MELVFLLVLFPVTLSVKHSLTYYLTTSSGLQTFPEFVAVSKVDGVQVGYCDSNNKTPEPRQVWIKQLIDSEPQHFKWHVQSCRGGYQGSTVYIEHFKQHFNPTAEVCIFQVIATCESDNETGEVSGYIRFGYDGEEFISLDSKTLTWQYRERAASFKQKWERDKLVLNLSNVFLKNVCPQWLRKYLNYGRSFLQRKELPSVSLLQKTPSSPVTCHATGFYPHRADLFWTKDGEELHEDVDKGEILPNHDGTFQMSVDLNISSIQPEDWNKYDCVFQLSGVKDDLETKLDKAAIRTNWISPSGFPAGAVIGVVVGLLLLLLLCIAGLFMWRKKNKGFRPANTSDSAVTNSDPNRVQLSEKTGGGGGE